MVIMDQLDQVHNVTFIIMITVQFQSFIYDAGQV